jgi:hypothetical protein
MTKNQSDNESWMKNCQSWIETPLKKKPRDNKLDCSFLIVTTTNHEETTRQVFKVGKAATYSQWQPR